MVAIAGHVGRTVIRRSWLIVLHHCHVSPWRVIIEVVAVRIVFVYIEVAASTVPVNGAEEIVGGAESPVLPFCQDITQFAIADSPIRAIHVVASVNPH